MKLSERITAHHSEQFGRVSLETLMLKLTEEVGEVAADIYRDKRSLACDEIGDCLIVLTVLAYYLNAEIETIYQRAAERFCARAWGVPVQGSAGTFGHLTAEEFEALKRKQIDDLVAFDEARKR